jgi:hypothetical protein
MLRYLENKDRTEKKVPHRSAERGASSGPQDKRLVLKIKIYKTRFIVFLNKTHLCCLCSWLIIIFFIDIRF